MRSLFVNAILIEARPIACIKVLTFAGLSLSLLATQAAAINTQVTPATPQAIVSFVDCNPSSSSTGQATQPSGVQFKSCSENNVVGRSTTSFDTFRTFGSAEDSAPASDRGLRYGQSGSITDSILVTPDDASLIGQVGRVGISFDFDGTLLGDASWGFLAQYNIKNANGSISRLRAPELLFDYTETFPNSTFQETGSNTDGRISIGVSGFSQPVSYDGTLTALYDVIFGEFLTYTFNFVVGVDNLNGIGGTADFESTSLLSAFTLFDDSGNVIPASFGTSSGEVDFIADSAVVPLPAALPLLTGGLAALSMFRRKRTATTLG